MCVFLCHTLHAQVPQRNNPTLTYSGRVSIGNLFKAIQQQMGWTLTFESSLIDKERKITVNFRKAGLKEVMDKITEGMHIEWTKVNDQIVSFEARERKTDQENGMTITGIITDKEGNPLPGASVVVRGTMKGASTGTDGRFTIEHVMPESWLVVSSLGYEGTQMKLSGERVLKIQLLPVATEMEGVTIVSTGYQRLPLERSTGSFAFLDSGLVQRRVSTNILDRLEGVTSGLLNFSVPLAGSINKMPSVIPQGFNLRGISTLSPNQVNTNPLVVLDNFPYEGNIGNINPNDIESITVLKDAAAASIWGARSGNGVIVLTSRKGRLNQRMSVSFNANTTVVGKQNIFYDPNYMSAKDYIEVETILFNQGYFNGDINNKTGFPLLSPVVEILAARQGGQISADEANARIDALKNNDVRKDYEKYFYRKGINQQYALSVNGGTNDLTYYLSVGHDRNRENVIQNSQQRTTITSYNTYKPIKNLELSAYINYSSSNRTNLPNEFRYGKISVGGIKYGVLYPYARLADANGNALSVAKDYRTSYVDSVERLGFIDWRYRPLDEARNSNERLALQDLVLRAAVKYKFSPFLNAEIQYQNEKQTIVVRRLRAEDTYFTKDLINRFSLYNPVTHDFTYNFPRGDILTTENYDWLANNFRTNLYYNQRFGDHAVTALVGAEVRELSAGSLIKSLAGYSDRFGTSAGNLNLNVLYPTNPFGAAKLSSVMGISLDGSQDGLLNRFVSYYMNIGYNYKNKLDITISGRKDGTNLFGVETNKKIVPLWSFGLGWNVCREAFYKVDWLPYLKFRASFGYNGNVYNGSAYATGIYITEPLTGLQAITNVSPANDRLRWEKIKIFNVAGDFATKHSRISGTIEYFRKYGVDLIEQTALAPQVGYSTALKNSASTLTQGWDLILTGIVLKGQFNWTSKALFSTLKDKVTSYELKPSSASVILRDYTGILYIVGKPLKGILSYRWAGLDPTNGDPQGYLNGQVSKDYKAIINNFNPDSLVFHGSALPTFYGSLRNEFAYRGFSVSFNIIYKLGYYFRRPTIDLNYQTVLWNGMNSDYEKRWTKPGDELKTNVPSLIYPGNSYRSDFYRYSEVLVEKGDHVRLQDLRVAYTFSNARKTVVPMKNLQIYAYLNNLGIIWRANKYHLDPDVYHPMPQGDHFLPNPFSLAVGIQANF